MERQVGDVGELLDVSLQRADALEALRSGPLRRSEIETKLDVSRTTAHRIARALADHGFVERIDGRYALTPFGEVAAAEVERVRTAFAAADRLRPFLDAVADTPFELDVSWFADSEVTTSGPGDPYAPVEQFMKLLSETDSLRGFDTTSVAPIFVDEIREEILDGMATSVVYLPTVAAQIAESYPEELADAMASNDLQLYTRESLPFGLALFDDRVGLGAYDDRTGMLTVFVDTDDPRALAWGERLYEYYRDDADLFELAE